jgi:hypothetical protein
MSGQKWEPISAENASERLLSFLNSYASGHFSVTEAEIRIFEYAAYLEPEHIVSILPMQLRNELAKIVLRPALRREEWSVLEGVCVRPQDVEAYTRDKIAREDKQFQGMCKLYEYFSRGNTHSTVN